MTMQFLRRLTLAAVTGAAVLYGNGATLDAAEPLRAPGEEMLRELGEDHLEAEAIAHECAVYAGSLAERWAAKDARAARELAELYEAGTCVDQDLAHAAEIYRQAITAGDEESQARLGFMYLHGLGVARDEALARYWFRGMAIALSAFSDHGTRQKILLESLGDRGLPDELQEEIGWVMAIESSDAQTKYQYALRFRDGIDVPVNLRAAHIWFARAFHDGLIESEFEYQKMQFKGQGLIYKPRPEYDDEKLMLAHEAGFIGLVGLATGGYGPAMAELGLQFATGEYLTKDIARAYDWYLLARKYGASVESQLHDLERQLAPAEIAKIVEQARMPGYFPSWR